MSPAKKEWTDLSGGEQFPVATDVETRDRLLRRVHEERLAPVLNALDHHRRPAHIYSIHAGFSHIGLHEEERLNSCASIRVEQIQFVMKLSCDLRVGSIIAGKFRMFHFYLPFRI